VPTAHPAPAPEASDEELVGRARAGDDAALEELLLRHRALVRARTRTHFLVGADQDDLAQEAMIGLYLAVRAFDPDCGSSFRAFADVCVSRQVVTAIRAATRRKHGPLNDYVSLHGQAPAAGEGERTLADVLPAPAAADPAEQLVAAEAVEALRVHVDRALSDLEGEVLRLHVDGVGYREIAQRLHRGARSIDNALQRVRRKVADHLVERELEIA
jgi:RNA polymerase sigma-H factor